MIINENPKNDSDNTSVVNLSKGQKVDLTKNNPSLKDLLIGLGWDMNKYDGGEDFDLDTQVFLLGQNEKVSSNLDFIFYNNLKNTSQSVIHMGDNRTGEGNADDEQIKIKINKIPSNIRKIVVTATIHQAQERQQNFGQVSNAFIRIVNEKTNEELIRYDLSEDYSIETAIVVGELYRHNDEWKFSAAGSGFEGGLATLCKQYGVSI